MEETNPRFNLDNLTHRMLGRIYELNEDISYFERRYHPVAQEEVAILNKLSKHLIEAFNEIKRIQNIEIRF